MRVVAGFAVPHTPVRAIGSKRRQGANLESRRGTRYGIRLCSEHPVASPVPVTLDNDSGPTKARQLQRVVCKFGGSSLADASRLREVARLVRMQVENSEKAPVVVLSAMGKSTNELLEAGRRALGEGIVDISSVRRTAYEACEELGLSKEQLVDPLLLNLDQLLLGVKFLKELSPRTKDYLVSFGERLSVRIFANHLRVNEGLKAQYHDAFDVGFRTTSDFTRAELLDETFDNIAKYFKSFVGDECIAVVTGFIAKDCNGNMTTLGRGGSDLTASALGAGLGVTEVQVWKDVDGILSTDPRIVRCAVPVPRMSFEEASEMAYFGAKVLHPIAMQPAMKMNIPVRVKNSYNPTHPGTVITSIREVDEERQSPVTAISIKRGVELVDIVSTRMLGAYGFLAEVFKVFSRYEVSVDMIATSEVSISLTIDGVQCNQVIQGKLADELLEIASVKFSRGKAIVSLVTNVPRSTEVLSRAMAALCSEGIDVQMISQGASKFNISIIVDESEGGKAVETLHCAFFDECVQ